MLCPKCARLITATIFNRRRIQFDYSFNVRLEARAACNASPCKPLLGGTRPRIGATRKGCKRPRAVTQTSAHNGRAYSRNGGDIGLLKPESTKWYIDDSGSRSTVSRHLA